MNSFVENQVCAQRDLGIFINPPKQAPKSNQLFLFSVNVSSFFLLKIHIRLDFTFLDYKNRMFPSFEKLSKKRRCLLYIRLYTFITV